MAFVVRDRYDDKSRQVKETMGKREKRKLLGFVYGMVWVSVIGRVNNLIG